MVRIINAGGGANVLAFRKYVAVSIDLQQGPEAAAE
jgi:hypothetical protein